MTNATKARIESALLEDCPSEALMDLAGSLKKEGMGQRDMYVLFDEYRARHETDSDQTIDDAILDAMDIISGWCSPSARLFESELPG